MLSKSLRNSTLFIFVLLTELVSGQKITVYDLPESLNEISGLEVLNDTTLIAINDGGNSSSIYLLNMDGSIQKTVDVINAKNNDWEDLARDDHFLYIADIGNNLNKRKDQQILKINLSDITSKAQVKAEKISLSYLEQKAFPPEKDSLFFDAESLAVEGDSLVIVTKNRVSPWNGKAIVYKLPKAPGEYKLQAHQRLNLGNGSWRTDSATGMDIKNGKWYILTYGKILVYKPSSAGLVWEHTFKFWKFTQKESVVLTEDFIFVADEKQKLLGGGKLYRIDP